MLGLVVLLISAQAAHPAPAPNPHLTRAIQQLRALEEQAALRSLEQARAWPGSSPSDLARIHLYEGLAHAGLANGREAISAFHAAQLLDPTLQLPGDSSPRVREWWQQARPPSLAHGASSGTQADDPAAPTADRTPAAAASSAPAAEAVPSGSASATPAQAPASALATSGPSTGHPPRLVPGWAPWALATVAVLCAGTAVWSGSQASTHARAANGAAGIGSAVTLRAQAEDEALRANLLYGGAVLLGGGAGFLFVVPL